MTETELSGPPISRCGSTAGKGPANWAGARAPASAGDAGAGRPGRDSRVLGFPEPLGGAPRGPDPASGQRGRTCGDPGGPPAPPLALRGAEPAPEGGQVSGGSCERSGSAPHAARSPAPGASPPRAAADAPGSETKRPVPPTVPARSAADRQGSGKGGPAAGRGRGTPLPRFSSRARLPGRCAASSTRSAAASGPEGRIAAPGARSASP